MRILLAMVAFVIAGVLLAFAAVIGNKLFAMYRASVLDLSDSNMRLALALTGGSLLVGVVFVGAGVAMLGSESRRE